MKSAETKTTARAQRLQAKGEELRPFFQRESGGGGLGHGGPSFLGASGGDGISRKPFFPKPGIQPKLVIGQPGDKYEQEADRVADDVVQRLALNQELKPTPLPSAGPGLQLKPVSAPEAAPQMRTKPVNGHTPGVPRLQTKGAECRQEEERLQRTEEEGEPELPEKKRIFDRPIAPPADTGDDGAQGQGMRRLGAQPLRPSPVEREGQPVEVQRQETPGGAPAPPAGLGAQLESNRSRGAPLPNDVRTQMEGAFGADFSGVRTHTDPEAARMSRSVNAQAFTHGSDVYFNDQKYNAHSPRGRHLLAHELMHVVQQGGAAARSRTHGASQQLAAPALSPRIQRGVVDDVASHLLTGNALLDFLVGVVAGIAEWIGDLVMGIVNLVKEAFEGNVAAVFAVIGIVIVIILAIIFPEVVVPILLVLGIVAGLISLVYYLYMMTRPGLTAYQRGKFLGKALVEGLLLVLSATEIVKFAKTYAQVARFASEAKLLARLRWVRALTKLGDVEKVLQLLEEVKDVEKTIEILGLVKDVDKALELVRLGKNADALLDLLKSGRVTADKLLDILRLGKVADAAEAKRLLELRRLADADQLERLLRSTKVFDGAQIERLLGSAKALDGAQLERLLGSAKVLDGAQVERLLGSAKVLDGAQIERLLGSAKVLDGAQIERLLGDAKVLDGAQIERLLASAKLLDGAQLERLLALVDDGGRLERLMALADTGVQLEDFLTKAGGASQAGNLEDLMRLAGAGRALRLTRLLNLAAGNAAKFQEVVEWTKRLSLRSATVPTVAPPPEVATFGFGGAAMPHFLDHTWEYIDIAKRLANPNWPTTTFWPPGTAPSAIRSALGDALRNLNPPGGPRLPLPGHPLPSTGGGFAVQVGSRPPLPAPIIGQFFPRPTPALVSMLRAELQAIWDILRP